LFRESAIEIQRAAKACESWVGRDRSLSIHDPFVSIPSVLKSYAEY